MTYNKYVVTFIESPLFSRQVYDYLDDEEYAALQLYLAADPDVGDVVKKSGGVRKVRWRRKGKGKSGGIRVMYFARLQSSEIWLLVIYAKSAVDSIPGHILKALREEMEHADQ